MSRKKLLKVNGFSFKECWERIQQKTSIENYVQLAEIIGISKSNITKRKDEDVFPIEWAFWVGDKFGLTTEWILKGEEVRNVELAEKKRKFEILKKVEEWLSEEVKKNPKREIWFEVEFEKTFQEFKEWKQEKEESEAREAYSTSRKVA